MDIIPLQIQRPDRHEQDLRYIAGKFRQMGASEHEDLTRQVLERIKPTRDEDGTIRFLAKLVPVLSAMVLEPNNSLKNTIARNVLTIAAIPNMFISEYHRQDYLNDAREGNDVYAYNSGPDNWYLWDTDTRIPLAKIVDIEWRENGHEQAGNPYQWRIFASNLDPQKDTAVLVTVPQHAHEDYNGYLTRILRIINALFGDVNKHHFDINQFNHGTYSGA